MQSVTRFWSLIFHKNRISKCSIIKYGCEYNSHSPPTGPAHQHTSSTPYQNTKCQANCLNNGYHHDVPCQCKNNFLLANSWAYTRTTCTWISELSPHNESSCFSGDRQTLTGYLLQQIMTLTWGPQKTTKHCQRPETRETSYSMQYNWRYPYGDTQYQLEEQPWRIENS